MATKKKSKILGYGKPKQIEINVSILDAVVIDSDERVKEVLEMIEDAQAAIKPIAEFIEHARKQANGYAHSHQRKVFQLDGRYWRLVQRFSRKWVAEPSDMPDPKPRGAKSLREICKGKKADDKALWNFITRRVPDPALIDLAVKKGYITEKEIGKAYIEVAQQPFLQRYDGEAIEGEDDDG